MKTVIVTGGSRGLGLGIARALASSGWCVVAVARRESEELIQAAGSARVGEIRFKPCDLADIASLAPLVRDIRTEFGAISGLVNNAGLGTSGVLANMPEAAMERLVQLNVLVPMLLAKHVVRAMMADGGKQAPGTGRIVNISSIIATTGYSGLSAYAATKAAAIGFTRSLARELGPLGITVNAVAPGFIETDMTDGLTPQQLEQIARRSPFKRLAEIDDVANAVDYLMSDKARNITGTVLTIDAGNTA